MRSVMRRAWCGVAVLLCLPGLVASGQQPAAEFVFLNAHILMCDAEMQQATALAVRDGKIVAVGDWQAVQPLVDVTTRQIDARGKTLTPGLIDSHLHLLGLGQSLQMLDLREAQTWEEIITQVEQAAAELPPGTWIEGRGWHQSKWTQIPADAIDGYPHHQALSQAVPDHPVLLTHASGHAAFANALAMKLAGITPASSDPLGGEILKDANGQPSGLFRENAQGPLRRARALESDPSDPQQRLEKVRQQLNLAADACWRHGITTVHDAGSSLATAGQLRQLAEEGLLPVRMLVMIREGSAALEAQLPRRRFTDPAGFLTIRSVKVSIDGALGPHGAWLLEPYADLPQSTGLNTVALDELEKIAQLCRQHDWQLCVHAIGDRANREVLDVYSRVLGSAAGDDHRWRIEHAQHLAPADIPRFGQLGVIPAMQANHCTSDAPFVPQRLGERRSAQGAYMWRALIDAGAIVPNGTDAPVERVDPRVSLYASVTRQLANGEAFYPDQCMTRQEALLSYTLWAAQAGFQEQQLGSLEVGKSADIVVWDTDLLRCAPEELLTAQVEQTFLAGRRVYALAPDDAP